MREQYVRNYTHGMMLRASLDLLWHHISWSPSQEEAITIDGWGLPFYLSQSNAPYVSTFVRAADRALYHATNAWRQLALDLSICSMQLRDCNFELEADALLQTNDRSTKYEIESFLGSVVAITEDNLVGINKVGKYNRLGKSRALGESLIEQLKRLADDFRKLGFESKWRDIRNSAYHLNPGMTDWRSTANIRNEGGVYHVKLEGVHYVEGAPTDFVELFNESYNAFIEYITKVRDLLTEFSLQHIKIPQHNTYHTISDPLGNMIVGYGKDGYDLRHFPQTAADFVGPLRNC